MTTEPEGDEDPRATAPCPLGLTRDGFVHDPKVVDGGDGYLRQCACGAWQKGYLMDFGALGNPKGMSGKYLVSATQLEALIKSGLRVPATLRDAVKRRLSGKS